MDSPKGIVSYSSLSDLHKGFNVGSFGSQKSCVNSRNEPSGGIFYEQGNLYEQTSEVEFHEGYDKETDPSTRLQPEVNLRTVLSGLAAIVTRRNRGPDNLPHPHRADASFLTSGRSDCDNNVHLSVCIPSAPLLVEGEALKHIEYRVTLQAEPPDWLPDSCAIHCMHCKAPFTALTRGRHHCRFCGGIFCNNCSKGRCLLPTKFKERNPQRVCDACFDRLDPLQGILINLVSNASQPAKHDVMDWTCKRAWLSLPVGFTMECEIYKSAKALRSFCDVCRLNPEKSIPPALLKGAKGLAVLTVAKGGAFFTYKVGTGLVVARRPDGSWSAPSAIMSVGVGWGAQVGAELTDFVIVLHGHNAVKAFSSRMHVSLGASVSVAAGPVGRIFEADVRTGEHGSGICYTYSCSKGAFVGLSMEGNFVTVRSETNLRFYGDPYLTTNEIIFGNVERPRAASPLYSALEELYSSVAW